jgi:succinyl-diaminopimelate desuccinylase
VTDDLAALAADVVRIESENPPGDERPCAEFVVEWFRERGIDAALVVPDGLADRPSAVAAVGEGSPRLVLNAHTDVVPAGDPERWSHDPYAGVVEDGRLYGRGSADTKTGLALAMLTARDLASSIRNEFGGSLVVQAPMGEETGDPGTRALLEAGYGGDCAVVLEPTGLRVATAAKGVATYRIDVDGVAAHASRPDQGRNAVDAARRVLDALDDYDARLRERSHPLCGRAYATVTALEVGTDANMAVVPERATILLDRRLLPGESEADAAAELDDVLGRVEREAGVETDCALVQSYAPASVPADDPLAARFRRLSAERADVPTEPFGLEAATDAREFVADDTPAVVWGPGDLAQAHTVDESVALAEATAGLDVLERASCELLA